MPLTDNDNVWRSPLGESMKLRHLDPRNHDHDTHGNFGYKTNREVDFRSLVFAQEFANRFHRWPTFTRQQGTSIGLLPGMAAFNPEVVRGSLLSFRWYEEGFVDDQVWVQAMGTLRFLNEQRGTPKTENQRVLWRLLMLGAVRATPPSSYRRCFAPRFQTCRLRGHRAVNHNCQ